MKDKEEFSRGDPKQQNRVYWLAMLNWLVPITIVIIGLFITTQKFAPMMNYDPNVIGNPLFVFKNGYRLYDPLVFIGGMFKFAFNDTYSYYFFQASPPIVIALILAIICFILINIFTTTHQKNQHIHGTARWGTRKDLENTGMLQRYGVVCGELNTANVSYHVDKEKASLVLDLPKNPITQKPHVAPLVCHSGRTNTWMIAPTRSGKGVSTVIPTCLNYGIPYWAYEKNKKTKKKEHIIKGRGSMVIFDPKGENWDATAGYRSKFSTCIPFRPLDPDNKTAHYNLTNRIISHFNT